jgi:hypothetical protein
MYVAATKVDQTREFWSLDATAASTPVTLTGTPTNLFSTDTDYCIQGSALYWRNGLTPGTINSCSLSNCGTTTVPIVPNISDEIQFGPVCDPASSELVWIATDSTGQVLTIYRSSTQGTNLRSITTFAFTGNGFDWAIANSTNLFSNGRPDRVFYDHRVSTTMQSTLYYIATGVPGSSGVAVATVPGDITNSSTISVLANDTAVLFSVSTSGMTASQTVYTAPLPNGVLSGTPPTFSDGQIWEGVLDASSFYGKLLSSSAVPDDAVVRCPLSGCSTPAVIGRGQSGAHYFAQDSTAIYWTADAGSGGGFVVWKAAK